MAGSSRRTRSAGIVFGWSVLVGVCSILAYVAIGRGDLLPARADAVDAAPAAERAQRAPVHRVNVVVSAKRASLVRGRDGITRLVLTGLQPTVEMADVSPGTERVAMPTWVWAQQWKRLYRDYEPNATIVWRTRTGREALSVALASGRLSGNRMSFAVRRLVVGSRKRLPITAAIIPGRVQRLGRVDVFVDPNTVQDSQTLVQNALQSLAQMPSSGQPWDVDEDGGVVAPAPNGAAYTTLTGSSIAPGPVDRSPTAVTLIAASAGVAVESANLGRVALTLLSRGYSGFYFGELGLAGGSLTLGNRDFASTGNVIVGLDLTGGKLSFGGSPARPADGNIIVLPNLTGATVDVALMGAGVIVLPTLDGTVLTNSTGTTRPNQGTAYLGADFSRATFSGFAGFDFSGAVLGPYELSQPNGSTQQVQTSFEGLSLGSNVTFSGTLGSSTTIQNVSFDGAAISGSSFRNATITDSTFDGTGLAGVDFTGATFAGATFAGSSINQAVFANANLQQADFSLASFSGATSFRGAALMPGTVFTSGSGIENADFTGASMDGVVFATGGGAGSPASFVGRLLSEIGDTSSRGVIINNTQYVKSQGQVYLVADGPGGGVTWQRQTISGAPDYALAPSGAPYDPNNGPGPEPQPPNPDNRPNPDPNGGGGDEGIEADFG